MVMNWSAVCLLALALCGSFSDAQWPNYQKPAQRQKPSPPVRQETTKQIPQDPQQSKQTFEAPLTWTYPEDPKPEPKPEVPFELRHPVPAATVAVECREDVAHVEVKKDMFGIGQFINPVDLTLGNCPASAEDSTAQVLIFQYELQNCQSVLTTTDESIIYSFTLNYNPMPIGDSPVVRTSKAAVIVECHYPRKHNVSSLALEPAWIPFSAVKVAEEFLYFTLKLMTADWMYERPSYQYFLGDLINIEATVMQYFHVPLRVYVDSCVATLAPEMNSSPRYAFIENNGCLVDARITGSRSSFMSRSEQNKLQFQLEAFRFQGADSGVMFITCHLRASSATHIIDSDHRACSWVNLGWREASGVDPACTSCESSSFGPVVTTSSVGSSPGGSSSGGSWNSGGGSSLSQPGRKVRDVSESAVFEWEGDVTLGPIPIGEKVIS